MFSEQLKKWREFERLSQAELAALLSSVLGKSFTHSNIQSYEAGTNPKLDVISALAMILKIPEQYLFDDSEKVISKIVSSEVVKNPEKYRNSLEATHNFVNVRKVPVLDGYAGAGSAGLAIDNHLISNYIYVDNSCLNVTSKKEDVRAIQVIGDSMKPYVDNFDMVIFTPVSENFFKADGKYIIETSSGLMIKNVAFKLNGSVVVSSENKSYSDEIIDKDSQEILNIVGVVIGRILKS